MFETMHSPNIRILFYISNNFVYYKRRETSYRLSRYFRLPKSGLGHFKRNILLRRTGSYSTSDSLWNQNNQLNAENQERRESL